MWQVQLMKNESATTHGATLNGALRMQISLGWAQAGPTRVHPQPLTGSAGKLRAAPRLLCGSQHCWLW